MQSSHLPLHRITETKGSFSKKRKFKKKKKSFFCVYDRTLRGQKETNKIKKGKMRGEVFGTVSAKGSCGGGGGREKNANKIFVSAECGDYFVPPALPGFYPYRVGDKKI